MSEIKEFKEFNEAQKIVLKNYGSGDYGYLLNEQITVEEWPAVLENSGDGLFKFLMIEIDAKEDCDTFETAMQRIDSAINDLQGVRDAMDKGDVPAGPALA